MKMINNFINYFRGRYHRHYREKKIHLAADIVLALIILILVVFIIAMKFGDFSYKNRLAFKVTADREKIVSGQEVIFEVKYANISKSNLLKTKFSFNSPEGFILKEVSPDNFFDKKTNSFEIGDLIPGANGAIKIKGIFIGDPGSNQEVILNVSYFLNDKFVNELFARNFTIDLSSLKLTWNNSGILYRRQPTAMSFDLQNISQFDLSDIELNFTNSDIYLSAEQIDNKNIKIEKNQLKIKGLKAGALISVNFNLTYDGENNTTEVKLTGQAVIDNKTISQINLTGVFAIKETDLSVAIISDKPVIDISEDVLYEVILKNAGIKNIDNLILDLSSNNLSHTLSSVKMETLPFIKLTDKKLVFDKSLLTGETQKIKIIAKFSRSEILTEDEVQLKLVAQYKIDGVSLKTYGLSDISKIKTAYQFKGETRYFSMYGDQLGVGPIPPVVDVPTKYWIFFQIKNHGNKLTNFQASAELPEGVIWSDESSMNRGFLTFDRQKKVFTWRIDEINNLEEGCRIAIALTIIPNSSNVSKDIPLLKNIKYSFFDNFTSQNIENSFGNLTNNLSKDNFAIIMMNHK